MAFHLDWKTLAISVLCSIFLTVVSLHLQRRLQAAADVAITQHIEEVAAGQMTQLNQLMELKVLSSLRTDVEKTRIKSMIFAELSSEAMQPHIKQLVKDGLSRPIATVINKWLPPAQSAQADMQINGPAAMPNPSAALNISTSSSQNYIISVVQRELSLTVPTIVTVDRCLRSLNIIFGYIRQLVARLDKIETLPRLETKVAALLVVHNRLSSSPRVTMKGIDGLDALPEQLKQARLDGQAITTVLDAAEGMLQEAKAKQAEFVEREKQLTKGALDLASTSRAVNDKSQQAEMDAKGVLSVYFTAHDIEVKLKTILADARYQQDEINRILGEIKKGRDGH